jgi:Lar family restriction alleviation protein
MSELKPCPFCGGEASIGKSSLSSSGDNYYFVNCTECLSATNHLVPESAPYTEKMAIEAWNTRTPDNEALLAQVEEYHEAIKWALGYSNFRRRQPAEGAYWWRTELRQRSGFEESCNPQQFIDSLKARIELDAILRCCSQIKESHNSFGAICAVRNTPRKYQPTELLEK